MTWMTIRRLVALLAIAGFCTAAPAGAAEPTSSVTGSEDGYQTIVESRGGGELSEEDFRQVSLLTSRLLGHVNAATEYLLDR